MKQEAIACPDKNDPPGQDWKTNELQDHMDNAPIGLYWVSTNGIIKWANKAELRMLGYSESEYIGHHISEFHVEQEKINDILERLNSNETLNNYESVLRCRDGTTKTVQISSNVLWKDGKFLHTCCFTKDITNQKKTELSLRESESRYRQLIERLQIPIYTTDADGRITLFNKAAADLWGREPEIGKDLWCGSYKICNSNGTDLPLDACPMAVALKEGRRVPGEEIIVVRPDGDLRNVIAHPQPFFDESGKITGAVNMLVDITEMRRSEQTMRESEKKLRQLTNSLERNVEERTFDLRVKNEELKKSEEKYHKMIEEVQDYAIVLLDQNGIIQNWNKGAENIKGYKEGEIVGKSFKAFYLEVDRKQGLPEKLLREAREKGKAIHEGWRLRKDGTSFWGSIVITTLHDTENNIVGFSKVTRDLTERKTAEDKLIAYNRQLEFQNKELEQFTYASSHDMKEPLRKISFYNNYVVENPANRLDEKSKEYLLRSIKAVGRMSDLIEDLLKYSKTNSAAESFEKTDLNEIIEDIVLSHKDSIEEKRVRIEVEGQLPGINAIPFQIKQLLDNLINNAIRFKHSDRMSIIHVTSQLVNGTEIKRREADPRVHYHKISVSDNGIGFEPKYNHKIFEIFQKLSQQPGYKGSGIGLAICKKIVQNHRGFIFAEGTEGEGARFDIYIPA